MFSVAIAITVSITITLMKYEDTAVLVVNTIITCRAVIDKKEISSVGSKSQSSYLSMSLVWPLETWEE